MKYRFHSLFRMELEAYLCEHVSAIELTHLRMAAARYYALALLYMNEAAYDAAETLLLRLLELDSLDEAACGQLIRLYDITNQPARAAALKRQFEKRFIKEMGVEPSLGIKK